MRLALEDALASAVAGLAEVDPGFEGYRADMLNHPSAGWCLRNYLILTERPELLAAQRLSDAELFWSRYYWLCRFNQAWSVVAGYEAGLEQQLFQLLEQAPDGWNALPEVEAAARRANAG